MYSNSLTRTRLFAVLFVVIISLIIVINCSEAPFETITGEDPAYKIVCTTCIGNELLAGDTLSGVVTMEVSGPSVPVMKHAWLYIDDIKVATGVWGEFVYEWDTSDSADGSRHTLFAVVLDEYGEGIRTEPVPVILRGTAPGRITDLVATSTGTNSIKLLWTATGDDYDSGQAKSYLVKSWVNGYNPSFENATPVDIELTPSPAGIRDSLIFADIPSNTSYKFWVQAVDEMVNISDSSNMAEATSDPFLVLYDSVPIPIWSKDLRTADFNLDSLPDLMTVARSEGIHIFLNNGNGEFSDATTYALPNELHDFYLADMDNDSDMDIITLDIAVEQVTISYNDGFGRFDSVVSISLDLVSVRMAIGDITGDNLPEIVLPEYMNDSVTILINQDGTIFDSIQHLHTRARPYYATIADFDNDGYGELAVTVGGSYNLQTRVYPGGPSGLLDEYSTLASASSDRMYALDIDQNGFLDLIDGQKRIHYNDGGSFSAPVAITKFTYAAGRPVIADINRDGRMDLLARYPNSLYCFLYGQAMGERSFYDGASYGPKYVQSLGLAAADFDGDGLIELAASTANYQILFFRLVD